MCLSFLIPSAGGCQHVTCAVSRERLALSYFMVSSLSLLSYEEVTGQRWLYSRCGLAIVSCGGVIRFVPWRFITCVSCYDSYVNSMNGDRVGY